LDEVNLEERYGKELFGPVYGGDLLDFNRQVKTAKYKLALGEETGDIFQIEK
jgi:hypothetical protein